MSAGKSVLVSVSRDAKYSTNERLVSRFIKLSKRERIREEVRERSYFRTRSQKRRDKSSRARRRRAREARKEAARLERGRFHR